MADLQIVILSSVLTSLERGDVRTSSELFELDLALKLSKDCDVFIFSSRANVRHTENERLSLRPMHRHTRSTFSFLCKLRRRRDSIVLSFGYEPRRLVGARVVAWFAAAPLLTYVFDSHVGAIEHAPAGKKAFLDLYFRFGRVLLRLVNGVLIINPSAAHHFSSTRVLLTRVGAVDQPEIATSPRTDRLFRVVYAGALETYNGVRQLVQAMGFIMADDVRLEIFGSGSLLPELRDLASQDDRIHLYGPVEHNVVAHHLRTASALVCLRDLGHPVAEFAFPSKLVEFLATGVPVISSPLLPADVSDRIVFLVRDLTPSDIAASIKAVRNNPARAKERGSAGRDYVTTAHSWAAIGEELIEFFEQFVRH